jgi:hypothetical protein
VWTNFIFRAHKREFNPLALSIRTDALQEILGEPQLKPVAQEVENAIIKIMKEAASD